MRQNGEFIVVMGDEAAPRMAGLSAGSIEGVRELAKQTMAKAGLDRAVIVDEDMDTEVITPEGVMTGEEAALRYGPTVGHA